MYQRMSDTATTSADRAASSRPCRSTWAYAPKMNARIVAPPHARFAIIPPPAPSQLTAKKVTTATRASANATQPVELWPGGKIIACSHRVHEPLRQVVVRVDPAVPQERPVRPAELDLLEVGGHHDHLFLLRARTMHHLP